MSYRAMFIAADILLVYIKIYCKKQSQIEEKWKSIQRLRYRATMKDFGKKLSLTTNCLKCNFNYNYIHFQLSII